MSTIHSPTMIPPQRERAPDARRNTVVLSEPPTGWPWNRPEATLASPCALKSPLPSVGAVFGSGTPWATP